MVLRNCGRCGKPLYGNEQICEGCQKALTRKTEKEQRRYEQKEKLDEKFKGSDRGRDKKDDFFWVEDDEYGRDAQTVWVDDRFSGKKKKPKKR
ncbi:MAG: hypothetical protein ABH950_03740 [Candidatus Altiarchaeota archaeon]